jgi:uncharacterized protein YfaP (DUF2135 family)
MAAACAALTSCGGEPLAPTYLIQDFITNVTARTGTVIGILHDTDAPESAAGPAPTVAGIATVVNGGSTRVTIGSDPTSFHRVFIFSPSARGHWEVLLPDGVTAEDLVLSVARTVRAGNLRLRYKLESLTPEVGPYAEQTLSVINVGTGDVQVSVAWTGASDVDLHVFDPSGEEIYYANKTAASGGMLDLDSNPACEIDNKNNENIVFPTGMAPSGEYRVVVDYYDDCGVPKSDWVVTVQRKDQDPVTFLGTFTGASGANLPAEVTTFTY